MDAERVKILTLSEQRKHLNPNEPSISFDYCYDRLIKESQNRFGAPHASEVSKSITDVHRNLLRPLDTSVTLVRKDPMLKDYLRAMQNTGSVAHWRFGEASGTTAVDASGNGHIGTYIGSPTLGAAGLLASDTNTAIDFPGADATYMQTDLSLPTSWPGGSFAAWINPDTTSGGIFTSAANALPYVRHSGSGIIFSWRDAAAAQKSISSSGVTIPAGQITFVVATHDGTTSFIYVNGSEVLVNRASDGTWQTTWAATAWRIGRFGGASIPFAGVVDEPAVWNRALSAREIENLYSIGINGPQY